jgi:hypothetical protein
MAKRVSFKPKKPKEESFPFGMNVMSQSQKRAYKKRARKAGHKVSTGGS